MQQQHGAPEPGFVIKPKTMTIPVESLKIQIKKPVDFTSLERYKVNMEAYVKPQKLYGYFRMFNGPTYENLVKDFWLRAEVYDCEAAKLEEEQVVERDPSLKGKTREEMGLEPFGDMEIRSAVMGIPVTITEKAISKECRVSAKGRFQWDVKDDVLLESYVRLFCEGNPKAKTTEMEDCHRLLLKFCANCFFQRGGGADQPNQDHQLALYFMATFDMINIPRYIMHHLCWAIKEGINKGRKQVPCAKLLSEIFHQGRLLEILRKYKRASDSCFKITTSDKILNSKTLYAMKIISKPPSDENWMEKSITNSDCIKNFPSILRENNPEILAGLVAAHARESEANSQADEGYNSIIICYMFISILHHNKLLRVSYN
jgi:hypothetical protein